MANAVADHRAFAARAFDLAQFGEMVARQRERACVLTRALCQRRVARTRSAG